MKANSILDIIGNTPHLKANKLFGNEEVWIKLERQNPGASIKDRIALAMIAEAEKRGELKKGMKIIEPTSGNTGIGLAMVCAVKGYELTLVLPESMSIERRKVMAAYGAKFELTPKEKGTKGAIDRAKEILKETPNSWMPMQFENQDNVKIHAETTAQEILKDFPDGVDAVITGVGTGGHITAVGQILKKKFPGLKIVAVEPSDSPVLSGGQAGPHALQGIGTGFVPAILDRKVIDEIITISKDEAFTMAQKSAREEGLFIGISSGASLAAVAKYLQKNPGKKILTFCYDTGERYLSIPGLYEA
jgi:cysteine synthase A